MTEKVVMSIFDAPRGSHIVCTTDADFSMKHGITKKLNEMYDNLRKRLKRDYKDYFFDEEGPIAIPIDDLFVLVVKNEPYEKATITDLKTALENLRDWCLNSCINKLYIPKLCCGYDGLDFTDVESVINDVFDNTDIIINICVKNTTCGCCDNCDNIIDNNYIKYKDEYEDEEDEDDNLLDDADFDDFLINLKNIIKNSTIDKNIFNNTDTDE